MATIIRIAHIDLGDYGYYDFTDREVRDTVVITPGGKHELRETQIGDAKIYRMHLDHYTFTLRMNIGYYDTLLKLWEIRELWDEVFLYPWFRYDQASRFLVIWTNPNDFKEQVKVGIPQANWPIDLEFREPRGVECLPPS